MGIYTDTLNQRFGGLIRHGKHDQDSEACALEVASIARQRQWSDAPDVAGIPDLRLLNDAPWSSDEQRTAHMLPMIETLWRWPEWGYGSQTQYVQAVVLRTIQEIFPIALRAIGLDSLAIACEQAIELPAAHAAARAAARAIYAARDAYAARADAAYAAYAAAAHAAHAARAAHAAYAAAAAAAEAARAAYAAHAARAADAADAADADADKVLILACRIWREEAEKINTQIK